jgi:hypothetical protein
LTRPSGFGLTISSQSARIEESSLCGPVAQLGARFHGMEEVVGSIPTRSTIFTRLESITSRALLESYKNHTTDLTVVIENALCLHASLPARRHTDIYHRRCRHPEMDTRNAR